MGKVKVFPFWVKSVLRNSAGIGFLILLLSILVLILIAALSRNERSEIIQNDAVALKSEGLSGRRGGLQGYYLVKSMLDNSTVVEALSTSFVPKGEPICLREQYDPKRKASTYKVLSLGKCTP